MIIIALMGTTVKSPFNKQKNNEISVKQLLCLNPPIWYISQRASLDNLKNTYSPAVFGNQTMPRMSSAQPNYYTIYGTPTTKPVIYIVKNCTYYTPNSV